MMPENQIKCFSLVYKTVGTMKSGYRLIFTLAIANSVKNYSYQPTKSNFITTGNNCYVM